MNPEKMSPEDIRKLLGGYATGTLTAEEQQALFAAALEDQELFDALAREQSLRDLLRDPAARAELLSALDTPSSRLGGFWQWLRRPAVAGLAMAGVVAIAVVAVWQGTRVAGVKPAAPPVIVAELRPQEPPPALTAPPPSQPAGKARARLAEVPAATLADQKTTAALTPPPATPPAVQPDTGAQATLARAPAMPPPPHASPALAPPPRQLAEAVEVQASTGALDARALFYANQPTPGANAFVPAGGGGGGAAAAPRAAKALSGLAAPMAATASRLGVRVSILRANSEADLTTVLDPGETVRLKLVPNADGFLYVAEGARLVASGPAERLKPFETPELTFQGSGQKQLYVMLSRRPQSVDPQSFGTLARGNLVESSAQQERATYIVNGPRDAGVQQVVVPVTLTYR
jgi:hypothetical protein